MPILHFLDPNTGKQIPVGLVDNGDGTFSLQVSSGGAGSFPVSVQRTPDFDIKNAAGNVAAGAKSVSFLNNGAANGTLKGKAFPVGTSVTFTAPLNDTLGAIAYDASGTSYIITEVR